MAKTEEAAVSVNPAFVEEARALLAAEAAKGGTPETIAQKTGIGASTIAMLMFPSKVTATRRSTWVWIYLSLSKDAAAKKLLAKILPPVVEEPATPATKPVAAKKTAVKSPRGGASIPTTHNDDDDNNDDDVEEEDDDGDDDDDVEE